jgi:hypothetical protein
MKTICLISDSLFENFQIVSKEESTDWLAAGLRNQKYYFIFSQNQKKAFTWAWSLIRNEKPIVLFERHCHATENSEAIACARRCRSSRLTRRWTQKE